MEKSLKQQRHEEIAKHFAPQKEEKTPAPKPKARPKKVKEDADKA